MKTFSQRKGLVEVSEIIQINNMSYELMTSIWNCLDRCLWSRADYVHKQYGTSTIKSFGKSLMEYFFKKPVDTLPEFGQQILEDIRQAFFKFDWYEVYDFLEFTVTFHARHGYIDYLTANLNKALERELSGYRIIDGYVTDITDEQEVAMLSEALQDTKFAGVTGHLRAALQLLSNRENPDFRNSIKESISAVESIAQIITGHPKATLGEALKELRNGDKMHPALNSSLSKLYGYTSDESGIRHAMIDEPALDAADAKFFLLSCTSFVNYLKAKL